MPIQPTYPGVYIQEIPSGIHTITGVSTSVTAFVGRALRGPIDEPVTINSYADFQRTFGGLWVGNLLGYAVRDFFLNGGAQAIIVRVIGISTEPALSSQTARSPNDCLGLDVEAKQAGVWGNNIQYSIDKVDSKANTFNLTVIDTHDNALSTEIYTLTLGNMSTKLSASKLINLIDTPTTLPAKTTLPVILVGGEDASEKSLFEAANPGAWGNNLQISINYNVSADVAARYGLNTTDLFNLNIFDTHTGLMEQFNNVTAVTVPPNPAQVDKVLLNQSKLARVNLSPLSLRPLNTTFLFSQGDDGSTLNEQDILGDQTEKTGLYALEKTDIFNLLCIPGYTLEYDLDAAVITSAAAYCVKRKAFFLIDSPSAWISKDFAKLGISSLINTIGSANAGNCAVFFPRIFQPDPLSNNQLDTFVPCGMIAGTLARIDAQRGIWKAPAGLEASIAGVTQLEVPLTDAENGELNPLAVNCLRTFPAAGTVIWGSRTLKGNDLLSSEWKYIPVRRFALYIELSVYRGTQWAVFEPNDAPLWRQLTLTISSFLNTLFRQGAFQGQSTQEAYFVKCDSETTTQDDINKGIVNIQIGFAPLKPAEFVIISIQQMAGPN
jgi:phage tail sheath protein FI